MTFCGIAFYFDKNIFSDLSFRWTEQPKNFSPVTERIYQPNSLPCLYQDQLCCYDTDISTIHNMRAFTSYYDLSTLQNCSWHDKYTKSYCANKSFLNIWCMFFIQQRPVPRSDLFVLTDLTSLESSQIFSVCLVKTLLKTWENTILNYLI